MSMNNPHWDRPADLRYGPRPQGNEQIAFTGLEGDAGPAGLFLTYPDPKEFGCWAKITDINGSLYSWKEVVQDKTGTNWVVPAGGLDYSGHSAANAYELSGLTTVPVDGSVVRWMRRTSGLGGIAYAFFYGASASADDQIIKITSASPSTITFTGGLTASGYAAVIESYSSTSGAWSDGATVWFVGANGETPTNGTRYLTKQVGQDHLGVGIYSTEITSAAAGYLIENVNVVNLTGSSSYSALDVGLGSNAMWVQLNPDRDIIVNGFATPPSGNGRLFEVTNVSSHLITLEKGTGSGAIIFPETTPSTVHTLNPGESLFFKVDTAIPGIRVLERPTRFSVSNSGGTLLAGPFARGGIDFRGFSAGLSMLEDAVGDRVILTLAPKIVAGDSGILYSGTSYSFPDAAMATIGNHLTVTLPGAGTYLVILKIGGEIHPNQTASNAQINVQLYNTTAGAVIDNTFTELGLYNLNDTAGQTTRSFAVTFCVLAVTGATQIDVQAQTANLATGGTASIYPGNGGGTGTNADSTVLAYIGIQTG